ncbi:hypothetical protein AAFF_G00071000 [Aldrovandia affinis]|uniref:DH domain-containing protein n=1 Tax=Aldrovandia affinis TaxID=143900 RepID=A0AAD7RYT3_9TELE|nr:hypothetical protein AAFF_G00071000 [Aldrovandia affinis]
MIKGKEEGKHKTDLSSTEHDHLNKMDLGNPSRSDVTQPEEVVPSTRALGQWDQGRDAEVDRLWASEKETESVVDGILPAAVIQINHKGAADKQRFNTVGYQKKQKHGVIPDFATVSKGVSGNVKPRGALKQALFSQGLSEKASTPEERAQLEALKQTLESFPLPALPDWKEGGGGVADIMLEESWTHIVHSHSTMSKTQKHQQEALWELVHTELSYINKLTIVTDLVIAALGNLRQNGFLSEVTPELLFSNLPSILQAHHLFWQEVMLPMVQEVRDTGRPFDPLKLEGGCLQFSERFSPYLQYCWEEERIVDFTRRQQISNIQFHTYLTWVESHPQVGRMRLGDMQAKPHQRITKYPLLLKAILKSTQDPLTQYSVRRMLTSVNSFLDSINECLRVKDDELALSLSALRVEGYEVVEGISEEIDKHIKEFCCFDLTSPILGVGPGDIRKLLLEETLKIRERKDNKLEVVVLLFSDVLLVTKAQRKSEKLKVVRPPLSLDRTRCSGLKDGCSFVLVEVSELGCAVNVHTVITPSPESCSLWISTIRTAQESLTARREREMSHRLGEFRQAVVQIEKQALHPSEAKTVSEEREEQGNQSEVEHVLFSEQKPKEEASRSLSANGTLPLMEMEVQNNTHNQLKNMSSLFLGRYNPSSQSARGHFAVGRSKVKNSQSRVKDVVMSEGEVKEDSDSNQLDSTKIVFPGIKERRVTWNHVQTKPSFSDPNKCLITPTDCTNSQSNALQPSLPGKWQNTEIALCQSAPSPALSLGKKLNMDISAWESAPKENQPQGKFTRRDSKGQMSDQVSRRGSLFSQSEDEFLTGTGRFSRKLKSPRLRRRRPIGAQDNPSLQIIRKGSLDLGEAMFALNPNSSSNSDSDCNYNLHRNANMGCSHFPMNFRSNSVNRGALWNGPAQRGSPEPQTFSEPELPTRLPEQSSQKRPRFRTQRSVSIPDIIVQAGSDLLSDPGWFSAASVSQSSQPEGGAQPHTTSLEDILERARGRSRDRARDGEGAKAGKMRARGFFLDLPPSPSLSTSPSLSPSEGDMEFLRVHTPTAAHGRRSEEEKEEGSEGERKYSISFPDAASAKWSEIYNASADRKTGSAVRCSGRANERASIL